MANRLLMCMLGTGPTIRRPEDRILHAQSRREDRRDADEAVAVVEGRSKCPDGRGKRSRRSIFGSEGASVRMQDDGCWGRAVRR